MKHKCHRLANDLDGKLEDGLDRLFEQPQNVGKQVLLDPHDRVRHPLGELLDRPCDGHHGAAVGLALVCDAVRLGQGLKRLQFAGSGFCASSQGVWCCREGDAEVVFCAALVSRVQHCREVFQRRGRVTELLLRLARKDGLASGGLYVLEIVGRLNAAEKAEGTLRGVDDEGTRLCRKFEEGEGVLRAGEGLSGRDGNLDGAVAVGEESGALWRDGARSAVDRGVNEGGGGDSLWALLSV